MMLTVIIFFIFSHNPLWANEYRGDRSHCWVAQVPSDQREVCGNPNHDIAVIYDGAVISCHPGTREALAEQRLMSDVCHHSPEAFGKQILYPGEVARLDQKCVGLARWGIINSNSQFLLDCVYSLGQAIDRLYYRRTER